MKYKFFVLLLLVSINTICNGIVCADIKKVEEKAERIKKDLVENPNNAQLHLELGMIFADQEKYEEAINEYTIALQIKPNYEDALFKRGVAYMSLNQMDKAIEDFNLAIKLNPRDESAYANLSIIYRNKKEYNRAIEYCQLALKIKEDSNFYYQIGCIHMDMGDTEKARELFNMVISEEGRDSSLGELALYKLEELRKLEPKPTGPTLGYEGYIPSVDDAVEVSLSWIDVIDKGQYEESWNTSAEYLRNTIDKERWEQSLTAVRTSLGKVISRKLKTKEYTKTLPGAPDGEYVIIQYETSFEKKQYAIETVIPMIDKDGKWRVSGYYIR